MKYYIVGVFITTTLLNHVNLANAQVIEVQKPVINNNFKIIENESIYLPSSSKGKPELNFPLSKLLLIKYSDDYLPGVIDLEYQDSVGQRLGIEDPSPQVLSIWHKAAIYLTLTRHTAVSVELAHITLTNL